MTIQETIEAAAAKYGVTVAGILRGGRIKSRAITRAREFVVAAHPEMGASELSRQLNYADHSAIIRVRKRIKKSHIDSLNPPAELR